MKAEVQAQDDRTSPRRALRDLPERAAAFAVRIVSLVQALPANTAGFVLGKQICRSGTSVGANIEEAEAAQTKPEFIRRMSIARSEARETHYWLRIISGTGIVKPDRLCSLLSKADELKRILTTLVKNAEKRSSRG